MRTICLSFVIITIISLVVIGESDSISAQTLRPSGGNVILLSTPKFNFVDGEIIPIGVHTLRNSTINIFLVDNYGNIKNSTQVRSDNTGYFNTALGIPSRVMGGAWFLYATSGENNMAMQIMVNAPGVSTIPFNFPSGLPPLKQSKLEIPAERIQCREGLQLILKSFDESPACVKPQTLWMLNHRGWTGLPNHGFDIGSFEQQSITITGLNQTQYVGKKIEFTVKYNGMKTSCPSYPSLRIENSKHQIVWNSGIVLELCDADLIGSHFEKEWEISDTPLGTPILNKTGSYALFAEFENNITQKSFRVNSEPQNSSREITILSVSPQNVTLPDNSKDQPKITSETKIPINKSRQIKITNNNSTAGLMTHSAQVTIKSLTIDAKGNPPAKSEFDTWVFDYSIENTDKSAHYALLNFEVQFGQKTYSSELIGDEFYWMLAPDEKRDASYTIQVSKGINQAILNVKDQTTKKILWSIPLDLTPYRIKYHTGYSNFTPE